MEEIPVSKKIKIIQLYLDSRSTRDIAAQVGVSVGTVANVIADLKNGRLPQVRDPADQIQMARELRADLKAQNLTLEQAVMGSALLGRLLEQEVEPAELGRCLDFWRRMAADHEAQDVAQAAFRLDDACQRTGLDPEALVERVESLQKDVARLEALKQELRPTEKELQRLQERRATSSAEMDRLEKETKCRQQSVDRLERREEALATRVANWEKRTTEAEERLAVAQSGITLLAELGLAPDELPGFAQRVAAVARKHNLKPPALLERLLSELEQLDKGLRLDSQIKAKRAQLLEVTRAVQNDQEVVDRLRSEIEELRRQRADIQGQIAAGQALLTGELNSDISELRAAGSNMHQALSTASDQVSAEMQKIADQALQVGQELGRYDATIRQNQLMAILATLLTSPEEVKARDAQFVWLWVLRRLRDWARMQEGLTTGLYMLVSHLESVISDLESWKP